MVLKIRLARFGKRNKPFYNIVVAQARSARNSKPLEVIGTLPLPSLLLQIPNPSLVQTIKLTQEIRNRDIRPYSSSSSSF